jgi:hypothetical protein
VSVVGRLGRQATVRKENNKVSWHATADKEKKNSRHERRMSITFAVFRVVSLDTAPKVPYDKI